MWEPVDWIALVIAISVGSVLIITAIGFILVPLIMKQPISDSRSENVQKIVIYFAGALIGYITGRLGAQ